MLVLPYPSMLFFGVKNKGLTIKRNGNSVDEFEPSEKEYKLRRYTEGTPQ